MHECRRPWNSSPASIVLITNGRRPPSNNVLSYAARKQSKNNFGANTQLLGKIFQGCHSWWVHKNYGGKVARPLTNETACVCAVCVLIVHPTSFTNHMLYWEVFASHAYVSHRDQQLHITMICNKAKIVAELSSGANSLCQGRYSLVTIISPYVDSLAGGSCPTTPAPSKTQRIWFRNHTRAHTFQTSI